MQHTRVERGAQCRNTVSCRTGVRAMNPTVPNSTEWGPVQCNFYHHTRANTSDLFVSHRTTDTVGQMLVSLIKGDLLTSAPSKQLPVFGNTVHKAPSAATGKAERGTEMPHQAALEADYSCVDMEGKWKDASKLGSSVPRSAEAQEASVPTPLSPLALVSRTETTAAEDAEGSHSQKALPPSSLPISDVDVSSSDSAACPSPLPTRVPQYDSLAPMSPSQGELASLRCWQWTAPRHTVDSSFVRRQLTLLAYRRVVALLNPHTLACGSYISMFSSGAEYSRLTQCFRAVAVAKKDVVSSWVSLAHCAALCILLPRTMDEKVQLTMALTGNAVPRDIAAEAGNQGHIEFCRSGSKSSSGPTGPDVFARVSEAVRGVYVHRIAENAFELGVVMHGGHQDPRLLCLLQCLSHWCQVSIEHRSVVLPICASLRSVSLRLWWMPQHSRVTPGSLLPPIKALVEEDRRIVLTAKSGDVAERDDSSWRTPPGTLSAGLEEDTYPLFPSYDDVALFLARPVASQLHGTNVLPLPHSFREYIMDREWSDTSKAAGYRAAGPDDATEPRNVSGCAHRPFSPASGVKKLVRLSNGVVQATLVFAETRVSTVGEHLLAAEMQPKAAYRPFVPTLCANVAPFLVVGPEEA